MTSLEIAFSPQIEIDRWRRILRRLLTQSGATILKTSYEAGNISDNCSLIRRKNMGDGMDDRRRGLEEEYFNRKNWEAIEKLRAKMKLAAEAKAAGLSTM